MVLVKRLGSVPYCSALTSVACPASSCARKTARRSSSGDSQHCCSCSHCSSSSIVKPMESRGVNACCSSLKSCTTPRSQVSVVIVIASTRCRMSLMSVTFETASAACSIVSKACRIRCSMRTCSVISRNALTIPICLASLSYRGALLTSTERSEPSARLVIKRSPRTRSPRKARERGKFSGWMGRPCSV